MATGAVPPVLASMATGAASLHRHHHYFRHNSTADKSTADKSTADFQSAGFFIFLAFMGAILLLLIWLIYREFVNCCYSYQMTVVSRSNHPSVVHAINSNGDRDEAVVAGVSESTRAGGTSTVDEGPVVITPAGLNEWVIDALSISEYRADEGLHDGSSGETTECTICLSEITDGQIVRFLPECCHVFHVQCIDAWLTDHLSCPLCRRAI